MVWAHKWDQPIGDGVIQVKADRATFVGQFWMDVLDGEQAYRKVKRAGDLQDYSYGFQIKDAAPGVHDGQQVRVLKSLEVFEVSPVLVGAGIGTGTESLKAAELEEKPIPGVHACRLRDPGDFQSGSFRTMSRDHDGKPYNVIVGRLTGSTSMTEQAYRYRVSDGWQAAAARSHCSSHDGARFEPAAPAAAALAEDLADLKAGRRLSAASRAHIQGVIDTLTAFLRDPEADLAEVLEAAPKTAAPAASEAATILSVVTPEWLAAYRERYRRVLKEEA